MKLILSMGYIKEFYSAMVQIQKPQLYKCAAQAVSGLYALDCCLHLVVSFITNSIPQAYFEAIKIHNMYN